MIRYSNPPFGQHSHAMDKLHEHVERAIQANHRFRLDQHYMVDDDKIVIIDESTGRPMPDRHWNEGLHQAVEAKEGVPITTRRDHAAQITYQSYFKLYKKLAGMTGTAVQNFWEMRRVYKLWVVQVPTNRPCIRDSAARPRLSRPRTPSSTPSSRKSSGCKAKDRPVLIGTRSVDKSEKLSKKLLAAGVPHHVLNAKPGNAEPRGGDRRPGRPTAAPSPSPPTWPAAAPTSSWAATPSPSPGTSSRAQYKPPPRRARPTSGGRSSNEIEVQENILEERISTCVQAGGLHVIGTERHEAAASTAS